MLIDAAEIVSVASLLPAVTVDDAILFRHEACVTQIKQHRSGTGKGGKSTANQKQLRPTQTFVNRHHLQITIRVELIGSTATSNHELNNRTLTSTAALHASHMRRARTPQTPLVAAYEIRSTPLQVAHHNKKRRIQKGGGAEWTGA